MFFNSNKNKMPS